MSRFKKLHNWLCDFIGGCLVFIDMFRIGRDSKEFYNGQFRVRYQDGWVSGPKYYYNALTIARDRNCKVIHIVTKRIVAEF